MSFEFVIDLNTLHVLGYAYLGSDATKKAFGREQDRNDPFHFLHAASLLALAPAIRFMSHSWTGSGLSPRSELALTVARDLGAGTFSAVGDLVAERIDIAKRAAEALEVDFSGYCVHDGIHRVSSRTPRQQGPEADEITRVTRSLLTKRHAQDERRALFEKYNQAPNSQGLFMLTLSDSLYERIHSEFWPSMQSFSDQKTLTDRLETLVRMYTYMSVPGNAGRRAWYSPQFDRVTRWQEHAAEWSRATGSAARSNDEIPLLLASISYLLLRWSDGSPQDILRNACAFRSAYAAHIDEYLPHGLVAAEVRRDSEVQIVADKLLHDVRLEFHGCTPQLLESLNGFLVADNGKLIAGNTITSKGVRRVIVKSDVHGERIREALGSMDQLIGLGRVMDEGFRPASIYIGACSMYEEARRRIDSNDDCEGLLRAMKRRGMIFCAGSGVTLGSIEENKHCEYSWAGLIRKGLKRVEKLVPERADLAAAVAGILGVSKGSLIYRFAGDVIKESLSDDAWKNWLDEMFLPLEAQDRVLVDAIVALAKVHGFRIATTNYDLIIERASRGLMPCVPDAAGEAKVETFFSDFSPRYVLHIHGTFDQPDSVVLGNVSYGNLNGSRFFRYVERLFDSRVLFVGFAGFDDPTFERLRQYQVDFRFKGQHFVLLRDEEMASFGATRNTHLIPISYGQTYAELPSFLHALRERAEVP